MKPKLFLCLALVLNGSLVGFSIFAEQTAKTNPGEYNWGRAVGGFQMAAAVDETNGVIHCWIRNATTNEMDYPSFDFGYFEDIRLEIHEGTNWVKLTKYPSPVLPRSFGAYSGCPFYLRRAKPGQIVTDTFTRSRSKPWPVLKREDYLKWTRGDTNEALLAEKANKWYASRDALEAATARNDTFAIDLFEMNQLVDLPRANSLEARVAQSFRTKMGGGGVTMYSRTFILSSSLLQSCVEGMRGNMASVHAMHFGDPAPLRAVLLKLNEKFPELSAAKFDTNSPFRAANAVVAEYTDSGEDKMTIVAKAYDSAAAAKVGQARDRGLLQAGGWNKKRIIRGVQVYENTDYGTMYFQTGHYTFKLIASRYSREQVPPLLLKVASALIGEVNQANSQNRSSP